MLRRFRKVDHTSPCAYRGLTWLVILASLLFGSVLAKPAGAISSGAPLAGPIVAQPAITPKLGYSLTPSSTEPYAVCPPAPTGRAGCLSIIDPPAVKTTSGYKVPGVGPQLEGGGEGGGLDPKDIQSAYKISATGGSTQTVAIVDAYDDPNIEADLKTYRSHYSLSECTKANGCFKKINQKGEEGSYPTDKYPHIPFTSKVEDWGLEMSLDVEMVSAICPECHIVLVEATSEEDTNLYAAEKEAASLKGITEISNSWGGPESTEETSSDTDFNHPGIPTTAAAGDSGYGVEYPAASKDVISVGGTVLKKAENTRGWSEGVWAGSGSGCSQYESKPAWQSDPGCSKRTDNDVAAVASIESPVSIYDSYEYEEEGFGTGKLGWLLVGGTSVATPLVAGIEAHTSKAVREEGAEAFYRQALFDVTSGSTGVCGHAYLCEAEIGYDGPTGWGAPDGPLELSVGFHAVTDPATSVTLTGAKLNGYVNPGSLETSYHFEYGPTTAYGTKIPVPNASLGSGVLWKGVSQSITGLQGTYHYRLVATNSSGTIYGEDHTLFTVPWAIQKTPYLTGSEESRLEGLSCLSSTDCVAVASYEDEAEDTRWPLAEQWNGTEWQTQSAPRPAGATYAVLYSVSCSSASACTAIGYYTNSSHVWVTLVERWNGAEWKVESTPNPAGAKRSILYGVSCSSSNACSSVGQYTNSSGVEVPFAESWNGTEWTVQSTPNPTGSSWAILYSVSCTSSTMCAAVGDYDGSAGYVTVAERWNGTSWSIQSTPNPTGATYARVTSVSCNTSTSCTAVGEYQNSSGGELTLAERWNGTEWKIQSTPNPENSRGAALVGVSCPSSIACVAVGRSGGTLAESWNGTEWLIQGTPKPEEPSGFENAQLYGISCPTSKACTAVGLRVGYIKEGFGHYVTLAESFAPPTAETDAATNISETGATLNGTVNTESQETTYHFEYGKTTSYGTKVPIPEASIGPGTSYIKVSEAITGLEDEVTYHYRLVTTSGSGTTYGEDHTFMTMPWEIQATPNPTGEKTSSLKKVSCVSASACVSVGRFINSSGILMTLAEFWNGTEWKEQVTPNPTGAKESDLEAVSCTASTVCAAVGVYLNSSGISVPLAERWNGEKWSIEEPPAPAGAKESGLFEISCVSTIKCTAVGSYINNTGTDLPLAEGWNGEKWSIEETPNPAEAIMSQLLGISCTSASACTAVGVYINGEDHYITIAEGWNGEKWSLEETPNLGGEITWLAAVSCTSANACTAVGTYFTESYYTLVENWNGKAWTVQASPNVSGSMGDYLEGVSCMLGGTCVAAGIYENNINAKLPLAERLNGTEWKVQSTPHPVGSAGSYLQGVSCASSISCVATGLYFKSSPEEALTLSEIYH
jgi:hypothetical protein